MAKKTDTEVQMDRRTEADRRGEDRREANEPVAVERRTGERRKVQRRRQIDPTTCERDYTNDEIEFMQALDDYKRASGRMFPTCSEILEVIRALGYAKDDMDFDVAEESGSESESTDPSLGEMEQDNIGLKNIDQNEIEQDDIEQDDINEVGI